MESENVVTEIASLVALPDELQELESLLEAFEAFENAPMDSSSSQHQLDMAIAAKSSDEVSYLYSYIFKIF